MLWRAGRVRSFDRVRTVIKVDTVEGSVVWDEYVDKSHSNIDQPLFMQALGGYLFSVGNHNYDPNDHTSLRIEERRASDGFIEE